MGSRAGSDMSLGGEAVGARTVQFQ